MNSMRLFTAIEARLGLSKWAMSKKMGKSIQCYLSARGASRISLQDLIQLQHLSGLSVVDFWREMEKEPAPPPRKKQKRGET